MNKTILIIFVFALAFAAVVGLLVYSNYSAEKKKIVNAVQEQNNEVQEKVNEVINNPTNETKVQDLNTTVVKNAKWWKDFCSKKENYIACSNAPSSGGSSSPSPHSGY